MRQTIVLTVLVLLEGAAVIWALVTLSGSVRQVSQELDALVGDVKTMTLDVRSIADDVAAIADSLADYDDENDEDAAPAHDAGAVRSPRRARARRCAWARPVQSGQVSGRWLSSAFRARRTAAP